jgi:uncharacterized membrane protein
MRYEKIDILRAVAVIAMILFHFQYTLFHIFWIQFFEADLFWEIVWKSSAILFMGLAGVSFSLAESKYKESLFSKYAWYSLEICGLALLVSVGSFFFINQMYIIFGILHYFSLAFLLLLLFRKLRYWNLWIALILLVLPHIFSFESDTMRYFVFWFTRSDFNSLDYYPLIPYFGYTLIGYTIGLFLQAKNLLRFFTLKKKGILSRTAIYIGQHSLAIYVIHLPFLFLIPFFILYFLA